MIIIQDDVPYLKIDHLITNNEGFAIWEENKISMNKGNVITKLSEIKESNGHQFRYSPIGFKSDFHCSDEPQLVIILQGIMKIILKDGSSKTFKAGEYFFSNDLLPENETFDIKKHGHKSANVSHEPLITLFIKN